MNPVRYRVLPSQAMNRRIHHRHSAQSFAVSAASRLLVKNAVRAWAIQPNLHWPLQYVDTFAGLMPKRRFSAQIEPIRLENCTAEWVRARGVSPKRAILYFHGGAFITCGLNTHRSLVSRLSKAADAAVLTVGYRKLPSHQIADAIEDGLAGLRWLQECGYDGNQIVVAGDSAGGYLAFMTALAAIEARLAKPAGIATVSPFTDADPARKLRHRNARRCSMFTRGALSMFAQYLGEVRIPEGRGSTSRRIESPVDADLSSLPPVTIHVSSDELLLPDAELMAERLQYSGVRCDLHLWDGQIHDFPLAADVLPEGRRAIRYIGDFIKEVTASAGSLPRSWDRGVTAAAG
ncbi:alpha/beta hydrolase [Mycobacterium sp. 852002-51057_SCH5723018]|uniref:alpha/beta hydrolase n=1 Tax=Mycobacterium sp. 852002-51057_SCH5723018 TaxID=1834094 RepID=UPI0008014AE4|nr:alpha/beta hydrolase [Mycobacterium sp. 852002-51057_SCH5723018]OBG24225.1 esterase [Mycobacterium sp. 852002-51057_SCH5723018]